MTPRILHILDRLDFWRLPADAPVEQMVQALTDAQVVRAPLVSTCIVGAGYDPSVNVLEIEFPRGRLHRYLGVPVELYRALLAAPSKGRFYRGRIYGRWFGARFGLVSEAA